MRPLALAPREDEDEIEDDDFPSSPPSGGVLAASSGRRRVPARPSSSSSSSSSSYSSPGASSWSSRLPSCRSALLGVLGVLAMLATYEYAFDEGVRERRVGGGGGGGSSSSGALLLVPRSGEGEGEAAGEDGGESGGGDGGGAAPASSTFRRTFTEAMLRDTRASATSLVDALDAYYGGRDRANDMLVRSWQAQWMLDDDSSDEGAAIEDADVDVEDAAEGGEEEEMNGAEEDGGRRMRRRHRRRRRRAKKAKMPKEGKVLSDPESMSPEELETDRDRRRLRTSKLVSTMARAILDPRRDRFVIGTIGSSVAAGHDNCHYDSYEMQLERTLTPVFASAKMFAIVQNAGEGGGCGDNHQNQVYCITHNVDPDVDVVHYSWTYFEKSGAEEQREQLVRWAQRMNRRPMVHHLVARGLKNTCNGDVRANVDLDDAYAIYGYNAFCIQTGLYFGGHDYDTEMERDGINRFGWQHRGDGYHNTTRYGEDLPDDDPRKGSLGAVFRNWHPGPLGFQIASDAFAYVYTTGLMRALDVIEGDMKAGLDVLDRWFDAGDDDRRLDDDRAEGGVRSRDAPSRRRLLRLPPPDDMPEPLFCDPLYCSVPHPPSCLNYEKPTFGAPGIAVRTVSNWTVWHEDNKWNYMVGKVDTAIIKALHDPEWERKCTHLDACGGITAASDSTGGALVYELPASKMTAGLVFICVYPGKEAEAMFLTNAHVTFKLNGRVLDKSAMDLYPNKKCVRLLRRFGEGGHEKEDEMLLSVEVSDQDPAGELPPAVMISHVVAL